MSASHGAIEDIIAGLAPRSSALEERAALTLRRWWVAERMAPTLLAYQAGALSEVRAHIRELVQFIEERSFTLSESGTEETKLQLLVVETELERLKFVARGYLRARLAKIDKYAAHWSSQPDAPLSDQERAYLDGHQHLRGQLFTSSFLQSLPEELRHLDDTDGTVSMIDAPDLSKPVAIRVPTSGLEPVSAGSDTVYLEKDGIYMLRYSAIMNQPVELV